MTNKCAYIQPKTNYVKVIIKIQAHNQPGCVPVDVRFLFYLHGSKNSMKRMRDTIFVLTNNHFCVFFSFSFYREGFWESHRKTTGKKNSVTKLNSNANVYACNVTCVCVHMNNMCSSMYKLCVCFYFFCCSVRFCSVLLFILYV